MFLADLYNVLADKDACAAALTSAVGQTSLNLAVPWKLKINMPGYSTISEGSVVNNSFRVKELYMDSFTAPVSAGIANKKKSTGTVWAFTEDLDSSAIQRRKKPIGTFTVYYDSTTMAAESCTGASAIAADALCTQLGLVWNGSTCKQSDAAACAQLGGTLVGANCVLAPQQTCVSQGGTWNAASSTCTPATTQNCTSLGGIWTGAVCSIPTGCSPGATQACTGPYGSGTRTCNAAGTSYLPASPGCTLNSCSSGYSLISGSCVSQSCTPYSTTSCAVSNGSGSQMCNASGTGYGSCTASSCYSGYVLSGGSCLAPACTPYSSSSCSVPNGSGTQTCAGDGSGYGGCTASSCNSGYILSGGSCILDQSCPAEPAGFRIMVACGFCSVQGLAASPVGGVVQGTCSNGSSSSYRCRAPDGGDRRSLMDTTTVCH